jgi:hypothetical protein
MHLKSEKAGGFEFPFPAFSTPIFAIKASS